MPEINLTSRCPISCHKLEAQKLENLSAAVLYNSNLKKAAPAKSTLLEEASIITKGLTKPNPTSTKMKEEKFASLNNYMLQLEEMAIKEPNNVSLRAQLSNLKNLLTK